MVLAWVLTVGGSGLLTRENYGNFYDAQAHSLLAGHWDVPANALFFEGFLVHGRTFTYFGIWPSVLRMPILEIAPALSGRLTRISMLGAFAVFLAGVVALHWRVRAVFRPDRAVSRADMVLAATAPIVAGCGTCAVFLASRAWVYHEAIIWGVAWALVSYERIIAFVVRPSGLRLAAASLAATLAITSRASIGFGTAAALALVAGGALVRPSPENRLDGPRHPWTRVRGAVASWGPRSDRVGRRSWPLVLGIAGATAVPVVVSAYVNWSRFGTLFTVPWREQVLFLSRPDFARSLDANGGSYFSVRYAPTTLLHYLRPDALARTALFPWVTFPRFRPTIVGNVLIDGLDISSSATASMPTLVALTVLGFGAAFSRRIATTGRTTALRAPLVGALTGVGFVATIAFIAERYLGDWLPLLILGSLAGVYTLRDLRTRAGTSRRRSLVTTAMVGAMLLAVGGVWVNGSLAILYQRLYNPQPDTARAGMVGFQSDVTRALGGSGAEDVTRVARDVGRPSAADTSRIVGACAAMYWSDGHAWHLVEGSPRGGVIRLRAATPPADRRWHPLVTWSVGGDDSVIAARAVGSRLRIGFAQRAPGRAATFLPNEIALRAGRGPHAVEVVVSRVMHLLRVRVDGNDGLFVPFTGRQPDRFRIGQATVPGIASAYGAPLAVEPPAIAVCRRLLGRLH